MAVDIDTVYEALKRSSVNGATLGTELQALEARAAEALSMLAVHVMLDGVAPAEAPDTFGDRSSRVMVMIAVVLQAVKSAAAGQNDRLEQFIQDVVKA